jgi:hypothetical protein
MYPYHYRTKLVKTKRQKESLLSHIKDIKTKSSELKDLACERI